MRQLRILATPENILLNQSRPSPELDIYLFKSDLNTKLAVESDESNYRIAGVYVFDDNMVSANVGNMGGCFGYVDGGDVTILCNTTGMMITVPAGFWFSTPGGVEVMFKPVIRTAARVTVFQLTEYKGTFSMGMLESTGRLRYIDGAMDTILHPPIMKGYPCLNALYMPAGIVQTMHTHPSTRAGYIVNGAGAVCETLSGSYELKRGQIFFLPAETHHRFRTDTGDGSTLLIVAFHPDSDFGPTHEDHPMISRTLVEGVSASFLPDIQTKP